MAGGEGTRLRPLTCEIPKPMVPILNKPVMEYTIKLLKKYNINDIAVTLAYLPTVVTDYFGDGRDFGVNLKYFIEDTPLGTGGSVKNAEDFLDDTFVVISGDALTDINLEEAIFFHKEKESKVTIISKKESVPLEYGIIISDRHKRIIRFLEKPSWGEVFSDNINTGIYIIEPKVMDYYKKGDIFDFSKDLFPKLLEDGIPMYNYVTNDYWCDIGDIRTYHQTQMDILAGKVNIEFANKEINKGIWIGEDTKIHSEAILTPPVYIGNNCNIGKGARINSNTVIGDNCDIHANVSIKRSIIWKNVNIGHKAHLSGAIVCSNSIIKNNATIYEYSTIGKGSYLGPWVVVNPGIKIWPDKHIDQETTVTRNIVWGTRFTKRLFGKRDIFGILNDEISPEFACRLGSAFASIQKKGSLIVVSNDGSGASQVIKGPLISGIISMGIEVIDINNIILPVNRYAVKFNKAQAGIHIYSDIKHPEIIHLEFINDKGGNIDRETERKIENIFNREDYKRHSASQIKEPVRIDNFLPLYIQMGLSLLGNCKKIKEEKPRILIGSISRDNAVLLSTFLDYIGCIVDTRYGFEGFEEYSKYLEYIARQVANRDYSMGIIINETGDSLTLIDKKGRLIEGERYISLISLLLLKSNKAKRIMVPYCHPTVVDELAKKYRVPITRTKSSMSSVMGEMLLAEEYLQFLLNFDGILGSGLIIDLLSGLSMELSQLIDLLPTYNYTTNEIKCRWQDKGRVIRQIIDDCNNYNIELFEGVKIKNDKGWALILPDNEKPIFNIYTEGYNEEYAQELSAIYSQKVSKLIETNSDKRVENQWSY